MPQDFSFLTVTDVLRSYVMIDGPGIFLVNLRVVSCDVTIVK